MSASPSFVFYTYSPDDQPEKLRWRGDGNGDAFFGSAENARRAINELHDAVAYEPGHECPPIRLERIETVPVTREAILSLLNDGVGAIVKTYDVLETIGGK